MIMTLAISLLLKNIELNDHPINVIVITILLGILFIFYIGQIFEARMEAQHTVYIHERKQQLVTLQRTFPIHGKLSRISHQGTIPAHLMNNDDRQSVDEIIEAKKMEAQKEQTAKNYRAINPNGQFIAVDTTIFISKREQLDQLLEQGYTLVVCKTVLDELNGLKTYGDFSKLLAAQSAIHLIQILKRDDRILLCPLPSSYTMNKYKLNEIHVHHSVIGSYIEQRNLNARLKFLSIDAQANKLALRCNLPLFKL
ncbi:hypothetical protein [Lysinibacillus sp. 54212]|uniref:hypothetical protein n=1 Tax=Lysinibacillus sp. 54212 TaxID=3119829 RepID=UPI002FC86BBB